MNLILGFCRPDFECIPCTILAELQEKLVLCTFLQKKPSHYGTGSKDITCISVSLLPGRQNRRVLITGSSSCTRPTHYNYYCHSKKEDKDTVQSSLWTLPSLLIVTDNLKCEKYQDLTEEMGV